VLKQLQCVLGRLQGLAASDDAVGAFEVRYAFLRYWAHVGDAAEFEAALVELLNSTQVAA
jgi:hypothetical protein